MVRFVLLPIFMAHRGTGRRPIPGTSSDQEACVPARYCTGQDAHSSRRISL